MDAEPVADLLSGQVTRPVLAQLLRSRGPAQERLFAAAREQRRAHGQDRVRLRGVIEVSNYCQKHCDYCAMRPDNPALSRYRLEEQVILDTAVRIAGAGIGTVFLQSGQDRHCDAILRAVIPRIREQAGQSVLLNIGEKSRDLYAELFALGADSVILKFETSDPDLYQTIAHSSLQRRLDCIGGLQETGYRVGTGNIIGLPGQHFETLIDDILLARRIGPDFVSSSPFIPNQNTPLQDAPYGDLDLTLNTIAIFRLLFPKALIPSVSALEKIQAGGQVMGLNAGANVVTINFTPEESRRKYAIYSEQRFVVSLEHARRTVERAGLAV
jgi:biotin synthase